MSFKRQALSNNWVRLAKYILDIKEKCFNHECTRVEIPSGGHRQGNICGGGNKVIVKF